MKRVFSVKLNDRTAIVTIEWVKESRYSSAHYVASIKVPFKPSIVHNLFVYDEANIEEAIQKAVEYAQDELATCTLI